MRPFAPGLRALVAAALALSTTLAPLAGQELRWQLPKNGAALYRRTLQVEANVEPPQAWIPGVWIGDPMVAAVLDGELAPDRQRMLEPAGDPRDLLACIALDLRLPRGGKARLEVETFGRFQPLQVEVVLGPLAADGSQPIRATLEFDQKAARVASTDPNVARLRGTLQGRRVVDVGKGLVTAIEGSAEFTVDYPAFTEGTEVRPVRKQRIRVTDAWTLDTVLGPDDAEFRTRVVKAIRDSVAALQKELTTRLEGPFDDGGGDPYHEHRPGELALVLLALKRSGEDARDPLLQKGYTTLRRLVISGSYELGVAILAMEALYTPASEWEAMRAGRQKAPMPRTPTAEDLAILRDWTKKLLGNVDTTVDAAYLRRWHYGPSTHWDNSCTQYALLGLYAAALCGVEISPTVWTASINHWLKCTKPGPNGVPRLTYQQDLAKGTRTRTTGTKVQSVGWAYHDGEATGSMTTAGISALTLCTSALRIDKKGNPKLLADADAAVRGGFLWLEQNFSVRHNPGPRGEWPNWQLYYLYGLERACELNQVALLGDRDWYFEGAVRLLVSQQDDGNWGDWVATAFGLLFLKKTALPAMTGR
ncbi:MAG: hypothetical protein U1F60_11330 [Planctomycetota bacterium]